MAKGKMMGGGQGCKGNAPRKSMSLNKGMPGLQSYPKVGGAKEGNYPLPGT